MTSWIRRALSATAITAAGLSGLVAFAPPRAAATFDCNALSRPVYKTVNPLHADQLLTRSSAESTASIANYGFTEDHGVLGLGSSTATAAPVGMVPVTRMYNKTTVDFLWVTNASQIAASTPLGYQVQQVDFYAPTTAASCVVGVHSFVKGVHNRNAWTAADADALLAQGWTDAGVSFYLKPANADAPITQTFSVAVIGDTQAETMPNDSRFANRTAWLAAHKSDLDIRYTLNTGDVVNWGWLDPAQFTVAKAAFAKLEAAGMPYSVTLGNHDTAAVGWSGVAGSTKYGGAAYASNPECLTRLGAAACKSWLLVRNTTDANAAFPLSKLTNLGGVFESGKIDNNWTSFTANNTKWMVLTLELWPRAAAIDWAKNVVASHPDYNVIIETHSYLNGDATISTSNGGYGATSPKYLYDTIVSKYSNVKIVTSGHSGSFANRTDTPNGNTVLSFLGNDLGQTTNPVRIITINTTTGVVTSTIHNPLDNTTKGTTTGTITITR
jgi:hypothetical protein